MKTHRIEERFVSGYEATKAALRGWSIVGDTNGKSEAVDQVKRRMGMFPNAEYRVTDLRTREPVIIN